MTCEEFVLVWFVLVWFLVCCFTLFVCLFFGSVLFFSMFLWISLDFVWFWCCFGFRFVMFGLDECGGFLWPSQLVAVAAQLPYDLTFKRLLVWYVFCFVGFRLLWFWFRFDLIKFAWVLLWFCLFDKANFL